jgi:hypothetical protein
MSLPDPFGVTMENINADSVELTILLGLKTAKTATAGGFRFSKLAIAVAVAVLTVTV